MKILSLKQDKLFDVSETHIIDTGGNPAATASQAIRPSSFKDKRIYEGAFHLVSA